MQSNELYICMGMATFHIGNVNLGVYYAVMIIMLWIQMIIDHTIPCCLVYARTYSNSCKCNRDQVFPLLCCKRFYIHQGRWLEGEMTILIINYYMGGCKKLSQL